jgi:cytochrome c553
VQAGLVPTKSGLLFAGDTHGNLLVLDANAKLHPRLLKRIDVKGALNSGLISYSVGGEQYVAAAVGGPTINPSAVAGALRVVLYGLHGSDEPKVVKLDRLEPSILGFTANQAIYGQVCSNCHGSSGSGPPLARQSQLADAKLLTEFLETVPPPMPRLYPGVLEEKEVKMIAEFLTTKVFNCGPDQAQNCDPPGNPKTGGTKEWRAIYSVLTSPRCINCHPVASSKLPPFRGFPQDYPRQADDRHPHYYGVVRGDTKPFKTVETGVNVDIGIGAPFLRCISCHGNKNDSKTGIPGAEDPEHPRKPFWSMAPAPMAWESAPGVPLTGAKLCARLKDKSLNGNRELKDTLHHLETEPLVNWAFNPGTRLNGESRTTPPISHAELIRQFKKWMADGAPCPSDKT